MRGEEEGYINLKINEIKYRAIWNYTTSRFYLKRSREKKELETEYSCFFIDFHPKPSEIPKVIDGLHSISSRIKTEHKCKFCNAFCEDVYDDTLLCPECNVKYMLSYDDKTEIIGSAFIHFKHKDTEYSLSWYFMTDEFYIYKVTNENGYENILSSSITNCNPHPSKVENIIKNYLMFA